VLEQIGSGKGYVDMSTVDAATSSKISEVSHSLLHSLAAISVSLCVCPLKSYLIS
jgi:hypothetical protein